MKKILIIPILFYCASATGQRVQCGAKDSSYNILKLRYDTITTIRVITDTIRVDTTVPVWCDTTPIPPTVIKNRIVFPLNAYLTANPYPVVNQAALKQIDTTKLISVMSFGAKGDGKTPDNGAIVEAIRAATYGIKFPAGRTYLINKIIQMNVSKDLIIWAYGATIKMADFTRYSFMQLQYADGNNNSVIWLGGTFDGNRNRQSYPHSPTGQETWAEAHGRFLGIQKASFVLVKDVFLKDLVMDGVAVDACKLTMISDCKAINGAPFHYENLKAQGYSPDQGSYFKATRPGYKSAYFNNLVCEGGSIGVHLSFPSSTPMDTSTLTVITNSRFSNQMQDAVHIEDCYKLFMNKDTIIMPASGNYGEKVHVSNRTGIASVRNCVFTNGRLSFNNASSLKIGVVDSCSFTSTWTTGGPQTFVTKATHVINSTFKGRTSLDHTVTRLNRKNTYSDFGARLAIRAGVIVDSCTFINGTRPVSLYDQGYLFNCRFINVSNPNPQKAPPNDAWKESFRDYISLTDDKGNWLGNIRLGL